MEVEATFNIRRYWFRTNTPWEIMETLNHRTGVYKSKHGTQSPVMYVDVNYFGESDRNITIMELRYAEWILDREMLTYTVKGDDGL